MEIKYEFPEKWCCYPKNSIQKAVLNDFIISNGYNHQLTDYYYIHYPFQMKGSAYSGIQKGYTEISFSEFEEYVLNKDLEPTEAIKPKENLDYLVDFLNKLN